MLNLLHLKCDLDIFINDVIMCVMIHVIVNNIHSQFQLYDADTLYKIRHVTVHSIGVNHMVHYRMSLCIFDQSSCCFSNGSKMLHSSQEHFKSNHLSFET